MKKILKVLSVVLFAFLYIGGVKANRIESINMDIYIDSNGVAHVEETWIANLDQGTEGYKPYYNLGESAITDFEVSANGTSYTTIDSWDIDKSFEEKSYKAGLHEISNGVELCWGISNYGDNKYTLKYNITNFVTQLDDADMVYWTLIPYELSSKPGSVSIKIHSDFNYSDDLPVWGYGNYGGYAYASDGYVEMIHEDPLDSNEYMTILIKFPKGTFNTSSVINKDFEYYHNMADEGAKKYKESFWKKLLSFLGSIISTLFAPLMIIIAIILAAKNSSNGKLYKKTIPKKDIPTFRDLPCKDDIFQAYFIASEYQQVKSKTDFLGTLLLKWIKEDIVNITTEEKGIFKNKNTKIIMLKQPEEITARSNLEGNIYKMMFVASKDGILEQKEFTKYCNVHYEKVLDWFDDVIDDEFLKLQNTDLVVPDEQKKRKFNATPKLDELGMQMAGLKKFYNEFGSIKDKEAIEVKLWREHLMYAQIFGVADKVAKEFKALYPTEIVAQELDTVIMVHDFSHTTTSAATSAKSRAESYSAGGGGFSSGGGGGGSFGGGGGGGGFR